MSLIGLVITSVLCALAAVLAVMAVAPFGISNAVSIALAASAVVAMSQCLVLAARPRFLEPLFGGLDRMYRVHKWLGITSLVLMIGHQLIEPHFRRWSRETALGEAAGELGEFTLYAFIGLILVSWFKRLPFLDLEIPYQWWRLSHRLTGLLFVLVAFHQLFTDKPMAIGAPLSLYLNAFCVVGIAAYGYTELVAWRMRRRSFVVKEIHHQGTTTEIRLSPQGRAMRWTPGQFAFVSVPEAGLSEPHPFTIANAPAADGDLKFAIKALGDWTRRVPGSLRTGMLATIEGPYGRFDFRKGRKKQLWLAGGIGITPFLAWAESLTPSESRDIHLVYCTASHDEAIGLETLRKTAGKIVRFTFDVVASDRDGRLTASELIKRTPFPVRDADMYFCGPEAMKQDLLRGLADAGQSPRHVHLELFEMR
jgi:predicted ferric reductase